ncbi:SETMR methyltransferase, partial [Acromyrmex heyeri]
LHKIGNLTSKLNGFKMARDKQFIRHCIRYEFHQGKSAAKACESICFVLGVNVVSKSTCEFWFRRFKEDDFDISDRERSGAPQKVTNNVTVCKNVEERKWMKDNSLAQKIFKKGSDMATYIVKNEIIRRKGSTFKAVDKKCYKCNKYKHLIPICSCITFLASNT